MQSNERFDTYLTNDGSWAITHTDTDKMVYSNNLQDIATGLNMQIETMISLIQNTSEGKWPALLGGESFILSVLELSPASRILNLKPANFSEISDMLAEITGDEIFVLITSRGKILSMSERAVSLFHKGSDLASLFDTSSSWAIEAAVQKCSKTGSTADFLIGHNAEKNTRLNYTLSMRKFPSPGKLIYCRLSVPSVAVVTRTTDKRSLIGILLEESFCPAFTIDARGIITSMNEIARGVCLQMWGTNPTGSSLLGFVHPDHRKTIQLRHEQRNRGFTTTSRFSVKLQPSLSGSEFVIDVSVVPIPDTEQYVIFARTGFSTSKDEEQNQNNSGEIPQILLRLLMEENMPQSEILETVSGFLGATSAAYIHEGKILTIGDSRELVQIFDPIQLAASPCGFREDGVFLHRIHSGFSISHLVFQGMQKRQLQPLSLAVLHSASRVLAEQEAKLALRAGHRILATVKDLADSFLKKTEPLDGMLSDLAKECRAETAVVFKINAAGMALKGIGSSGVVGMLPELPIEALNTASWSCVRGETAFFAETPEDDLRFSPVFPNSRSELAVPFFNGSVTDGVILLASTETETFHYVATELIQMMAILFSTPENYSETSNSPGTSNNSNAMKLKALDYIVHSITALYYTSQIHVKSVERSVAHCDDADVNTRRLSDSVRKLSFFSKWTLWWLRISVYNGSPLHRWINPVPLLEKVLNEFRVIYASRSLEVSFHPPRNDIEVCTDGAFVSMIAYSLLMCIIDNCESCKKVDLTLDQMEDHWFFRFDTSGGSIPGECLTIDRQPEEINMAFALAWKLTEELGGTVSTLSNRGKTTRMIVRLKVSG
ncbi:MAG: PAS domain-containing sensor histidine kinase [Candidatus Sabulitectum sp.]|nr:PAS domain-containing sensor histidine kinase [Candidatus Sabulitectum sp.]